jgi:hypothetical protein
MALTVSSSYSYVYNGVNSLKFITVRVTRTCSLKTRVNSAGPTSDQSRASSLAGSHAAATARKQSLMYVLCRSKAIMAPFSSLSEFLFGEWIRRVIVV